MDDETLDRLVAEAQRGNPEAFGRIFDAYAGPIHRFIASRVYRPSDAEDLTQLVFVKALEALPRYEARGIPFGGWLFRLARNAIIDQVRTRRDHLSLVAAMTRETEDAGPEAMASLRDDLDRVAGALTGLTDDQREVIELRFFAGLSVHETADAMGRQDGHRPRPPVPRDRVAPALARDRGRRAGRRVAAGAGELVMGSAEFERYANDRVEDMLDAYANARLEPAGPVLARIRANVMAHAAAAAATSRVLDAPTLAPARSRFAWLQAPLPRRAMALGLAASLTLGTAAAVFAAPPGSPFYNARLVIETALMPSVADIDARLAAYEEQLDARHRGGRGGGRLR